jgi:hypothetical protein
MISSTMRRGAIVPMAAIFLLVLMGLLAMVIDNGSFQRQRRMAQAAADAGARAGANEIFRSRSSVEIQAAAVRETARNGFVDGTNSTVTVTYPTTSVNAPGSNFVKVSVQRTVGTIFASVFGIGSGTIRAVAVGGVGLGNSACLTVTEPTAADALYVKSGNLATPSCGIFVASSNANAVNIPARGAIDASSLAVVGGPGTPPPGVDGPYSAGVPLPPGGADPLAALTMPTVGPCNGAYGAYQDFTGTTLSPGVYCGGISIKTGTVTMAPGLYILAGGGLYLKNTTVVGSGVTIVNTNAPDANGGAANFGVPNTLASAPNTAIEIEVTSDVQLSAMTTGSLAGILIYGDPAAGVAGTVYTNYLYSASPTALMGTLYFPTEGLQAKSHSTLTVNGAVVARRVTINTGNENITINGPASGPNYYPIKQPTIVE